MRARAFVVRWDAVDMFVRDLRSSVRPYVSDPQQAKRWKTRAAAERWVEPRQSPYAGGKFTIKEIEIT
jgi:hypothetical protein